MGWWGGTVQDTGPQETAAEVDNILYVLSVCLHVSCDWSLLSWVSLSLLLFAVDSLESLTPPISV